MKTLNYLVAGMIGAGSLVIGNKGYGQEIYKGVALQVIDNNYNHIVDEYVLYYIQNNQLNILRYIDEEDDGKIDLYNLSYYFGHTNKITNWTSGKIDNDKGVDAENKERHKKLISKFQENYSIGTYALDKGITCSKQNILDCLIDLF